MRRTDARGFATLLLDRPPLNVLTTAMMWEVARAVERASADRSVNAVQIRGAGRAFSAGVDIADHTAGKAGGMMDAFLAMLKAVDTAQVPVVAAVHGHCLGGGLELAACCDLVYAASSAKLGQPEVKVGVFAPGALAGYPSRIGLRATAEVVLLGEPFSAPRAKEMGLVNGVFDDDALFARVDEICAGLGALSRPVLALTKRALRESAPAFDPAVLDRLRALYLGDLMGLADAAEGLSAFAERRRPVFKGQ